MLRHLSYLLSTFWMLCAALLTQAQPDSTSSEAPQSSVSQAPIRIREIFVTGNKITRQYIVLREVVMKKGEAYTMPDILSHMETSKNNLMNTSLFVDVTVEFSNWMNDSINILVDVKERWYYYPVPHFKPVDRNWNVWISQNKVSLERIDYGIKFLGNNISGRNDKINLWLVSGYTRQVAFSYHNPYVDKKLQHGLGFDVSYSKNREINYTTRENQQVFFRNTEDFVRERFYAGLSYSFRPGSIVRHSAKVGMIFDNIADTVMQLNPKFFNNGQSHTHFSEIRYRFQYLNVDYIPYPNKGTTLEFNFLNRGIIGEQDLTQLSLRVARYWELPRKFFFNLVGETHLKLPFKQSFHNLPMLGYSDSYLRGLEYYVIDGVAGGFVRSTLRKQVAAVKLKTGLNSRTYGQIPFTFYLKLYGDAGYVHDRNNITGNTLTNKFLYTGGIGLDIVTIYDFVFRFEFSFNQLGEGGFFYHKNDF